YSGFMASLFLATLFMASLKTISLLLAPLAKTIISIDASTSQKLKWIFTESFKNMLVFIFCLSIWLIRLFIHTVNTFLPSPVFARGEKTIIITSLPPNSLTGSAIGRALSQVLALVIETPVDSRKYEFVRNLADEMIEENWKEESLREVNRMALSAGFERTVNLLNSALRDHGTGGMALKMIRRISCLNKHSFTANPPLQSTTTTTITESVLAEKLATDLLWFAEKLAGTCGVEEAIVEWSEASNLANLSLSAHPRIQASLVRVSVNLLREEGVEEGKRVKMLMTWLPLLANEVEGVVLSGREKCEAERVVEKMIEGLADKEAVLANWLHHYSHSNSDWPNLQRSYHQWCHFSRTSFNS
ncbi:hypothetical protein KI387_004179, partial [Taxus chinensis]